MAAVVTTRHLSTNGQHSFRCCSLRMLTQLEWDSVLKNPMRSAVQVPQDKSRIGFIWIFLCAHLTHSCNSKRSYANLHNRILLIIKDRRRHIRRLSYMNLERLWLVGAGSPLKFTGTGSRHVQKLKVPAVLQIR